MRAPPQPLYTQVLDLAAAITNAAKSDDEEAQAQALAELRDLYRSHADLGPVDPFLTETLADYESDPSQRVQLYRAALAQSHAFPGEPLYTKQIGLAESLIEIGQTAEARTLLEGARSVAAEANDEVQSSYADTLLSRVAV